MNQSIRSTKSFAGQSDVKPKLTCNDIQMVQGLIERCLQMYMNQTEVVEALETEANVTPMVTCLVWRKLEEQNPEFFHWYHLRLRVKEQMTAFNLLVSQQALLMQRLGVQLPSHGDRDRVNSNGNSADGFSQGDDLMSMSNGSLSYHEESLMPYNDAPSSGFDGGKEDLDMNEFFNLSSL